MHRSFDDMDRRQYRRPVEWGTGIALIPAGLLVLYALIRALI